MPLVNKYILILSFIVYVLFMIKAVFIAGKARKINPAITSVEFIKSKDPEIKELFRKAGLLIVIGFCQVIFCTIVVIIINTITGNFEW
ncbi:hypothetical protein SDC9_53716 [bioreactor metagenome]|uniref:Uncharacterized protein n=1 Tax=bioreactor metagenome TaxID=1076179 RepID=A0A644WU46_9ZZZZ